MEVEHLVYHPIISKNQTFTWSISLIKTTSNENSWVWEWANRTQLSQGENISFEWVADPEGLFSPESMNLINSSNPIVKISDRLLRVDWDETFFHFLIIPSYIRNVDSSLQSGFRVVEKFWPINYQLPLFKPPSIGDYYPWVIEFHNASLDNTGINGTKNTIIFAQITSTDPNGPLYPLSVFDIAFDAITGIVKWLKFPSTSFNSSIIANASHSISQGLQELMIVCNSDFNALYKESDWVKKESNGFFFSLNSLSRSLPAIAVLILGTITVILTHKRKKK